DGAAPHTQRIRPRKVALQGHRAWHGGVAAALIGVALASMAPTARAEARGSDLIVQFGPSSTAAGRAAAVRAAGGQVTRDVALIHAAGVRIPRAGAARLAALPGVHLSPNAAVRTSAAVVKGYNPTALATSY